MDQRNTALAAVATAAPASVLRQPRTWMVVGLAAVGAGLAFNWDWLAAAGVAPILIAVAPCLAMCALGLCMRGALFGGRPEERVAAETPDVSSNARPGVDPSTTVRE